MAHSKFASKKLAESTLIATVTLAVECQLCDNSEFFYGNKLTAKEISGILYEQGWRYVVSIENNIQGALCNQCCNRKYDNQEFLFFEAE